MPDNYSRRRFDLPDDWEPDGVWCFGMRIPADTQYLDRLMGLIDDLTWSRNHQRDATKTGAATVARTWKNAINLVPVTVGDCFTVPIPPVPTQPAADDAAAAIFTVLFQHWVTYLNTCAPTSATCDQCVDDLMSELLPYGAGDAVRGALNMLCHALNADSGARASFETDCPYMDEFADLREKIAANQYDWLNKLNDWLFDWLNRTANNILQTLNMAAGLLGGHAIAGFIDDNGGIPEGGGAGFGGEDGCEWDATLDFRESNWGFTLADLGPAGTRGVWLPGVGWQTSTGLHAPGSELESTGLWIELEHPDFELNRTRAIYSLHYADTDGLPSNNRIFYVYEVTLQPYMQTIQEGDYVEYDPGLWAWTTGESPMTVRVWTEWGQPLGSPHGYACLHEISFHGRGINPWLNPP